MAPTWNLTSTQRVLLDETGPFALSNSTAIGNIDISDNMTYRMDITIHSFPNSDEEWYDLFQCSQGIDIWTRVPLIAIHYTADDIAGDLPGFHIRYSTVSDWNHPADVLSMGDTLVKDQTYHIEMQISQQWFHVWIDGVDVYSANKSQHTLYSNITCWARAPYWPYTPNVTLTNILIVAGTT